jgi:threonine dehydratase
MKESESKSAFDYSSMLTLSDIMKAKHRLKNVIRETKLIYSELFSNEYNNNVFIKPENLQVTGAFKIRGAYNKISKMTVQERQNGLITASAGNHAQGVAYAAKALDAKAVIVMPEATPLIKVEATRKYGAEVVLYGTCYDEACEEAKRLEKIKGYTFVHPFDDLDVIAGQGTIGVEILDELSEVDVIMVPVGGGGLISGIAAAAKVIKPDIKIIGVEPEGAMAMKLSLKNNKIVNLETVMTIADGVAVKNPGNITFEIIRDLVDEIVTVSDFELMEAFLILLEKHKIIAENSGVLPLAALKKIKEKGKNIVCVVSGGNIDVLTISSMINRGLVSRGRIFRFSLELIDRPGQLNKVSEILYRLNANVIKLDHDKYKPSDSFSQVHLEVTVETNGHEHVERIIKEFSKEGFSVLKVY